MTERTYTPPRYGMLILYADHSPIRPATELEKYESDRQVNSGNPWGTILVTVNDTMQLCYVDFDPIENMRLTGSPYPV